MIQPGSENPRPAQLAPVLVQHEIVRIVRTSAVITEVAKRLSWRESADEHPVAAVLEARGAVEDIVEIVLLQPAPTAVERIANRGRVRDHERLAIELGKIDVDHVVADRMVKGGADHLDTACQLRIRRRVDFNLIHLTLWVSHAEARLNAAALAPGDLPAVDGHPLGAIGAPRDFWNAQWLAADPIGKPARVRDFVDRVDVERANIPSLSGMSERIDDEVVAVRVFDRPGLRRVHCAIVIRPARIVGIEVRRGRAKRHERACGQQADEAGKRHPRRRTRPTGDRPSRKRRQRRYTGACHHDFRTRHRHGG